MSDVIDELADEAEGRIDRGHVERRVADWRKRVSDLYDAVEGWLPPDFSTSRRRLLPMREKMMIRYGVPEIGLPILEMFDAGAAIGELVPDGLWILGANGRIYLWTKSQHFLIVDRSQNFAAPKWTIAPSRERQNWHDLDRQSFLQAIGR